MASIYIQKNSPYYWLRYYDKFEQEPSKKRKSINTSIRITPADQKRIIDWEISGADPNKKPKIQGNKKTSVLIERFTAGVIERKIAKKTSVRLSKKLKLSEGLNEFLSIKARIGDPQAIKPKTQQTYKYSVKHFINANRDKFIDSYSNFADFSNFLLYMENIEASMTSRAIYTRHLYALWEYFVKQKYCDKNIIEKIRVEKIEPRAIPLEDINRILNFFADTNKDWYNVIYFMLLTGCRPSTVMVQKRSDIDMKRNIMKMTNVKARKLSKTYLFPIYTELRIFLKNLLAEPNPEGDDRLFPKIKLGSHNYTDGLWFWYPEMRKLYLSKLISERYQMKQLRKTFASYLVNELQVDPFIVQKLLDHSDIKISDEHYIEIKLEPIRRVLNKAEFRQNDELL
jgi:integrase